MIHRRIPLLPLSANIAIGAWCAVFAIDTSYMLITHEATIQVPFHGLILAGLIALTIRADADRNDQHDWERIDQALQRVNDEHYTLLTRLDQIIGILETRLVGLPHVEAEVTQIATRLGAKVRGRDDH